MFKFYKTYDIISEINLRLKKSEFSVQILINHNDLFFLSENLFKILDKNVVIEIILVSDSDSKTLKMINLCKRLVDGGADIYWYNNSIFFNEEHFFAIFEKTYLIEKSDSNETIENFEEIVRRKNSIFRNIVLKSDKIKLLTGAIIVDFETEKTIAQKNETVKLNWTVKNAYHARIEPTIGDIPLIGSTEILVESDQSFELIATNKESVIKKKIFIRVLETKNIDFEISVLDPILEDFLNIEPSSNNDGNYGVYLNQRVNISWDINMIGKLHEGSLGYLPLVGNHEFKATERKKFSFTFKAIERTQKKNLVFHPFEDLKIKKKLNLSYIKNQKINKPSLLILFKNNLFLLMNLFYNKFTKK